MPLYLCEKEEFLKEVFNSLEGAWSAVACVQVLKLKPWYEPRKSPLNIEIIEFC